MLLFADRNGRVERIIYDATGFSTADKKGAIEVQQLPEQLKDLPQGKYSELYIDAHGIPYYKVLDIPVQPSFPDPPVEETPGGENPSNTLEKRVTDLEDTSLITLNAVTEVYEENLTREEETLNNMIATAEVFEQVISLEEQLAQVKAEVEALKGGA